MSRFVYFFGTLVAIFLALGMFQAKTGARESALEIKRLKKEIDKINKDIKQINGKLSNEKFLQNAPQDVVEEQKRRKDDAEKLLNKLSSALKQLAAA